MNIHFMSLEGGFGAMVFGGNTTTPTAGAGLRRTSVHNIIIDGLIYTAAHSSSQLFRAFVSGLTIRNALVIIPAMHHWRWNCFAFLVGITHDTFDQPTVGDAPIRVYNNTFFMGRNSAQNASYTPSMLGLSVGTTPGQEASGAFTNMVEENHVIHMPNLDTPLTTCAPLSGNILWEADNLGSRVIEAERKTTFGSPVAVDGSDVLAYPIYSIDGSTTDASHFAGSLGNGYASFNWDLLAQAAFGHNADSVDVTNNTGQDWGVGAVLSIKTDGGDASKELSATVPNGASVTVPGTSGSTSVSAAKLFYRLEEWGGDIDFSYGGSDITFTNRGDMPIPSGVEVTFGLDMGSTAPAPLAIHATPAGSVRDYRPQSGSAALGSALSGNVARYDLVGADRVVPPSAGAWADVG
ncbi:hypothetical protein ACFMPD_02645 [Sedimentitalea sp. HM32M-2]